MPLWCRNQSFQEVHATLGMKQYTAFSFSVFYKQGTSQRVGTVRYSTYWYLVTMLYATLCKRSQHRTVESESEVAGNSAFGLTIHNEVAGKDASVEGRLYTVHSVRQC